MKLLRTHMSLLFGLTIVLLGLSYYSHLNSLEVGIPVSSTMLALVEPPKTPRSSTSRRVESIAFGMAVTFRMLGETLENDTADGVESALQTTPLFKHFLPTLCSTVNIRYNYTLYLAHDYNDVILANTTRVTYFSRLFRQYVSGCVSVDASVHLVECQYSGKPAWSQNDAMMAAYAHGHDYYYMANDDTRFITNDWAAAFIRALKNMHPPNVGMVGPSTSRGNRYILTYNFVHITHFEIFGYFMPRNFSDWFGDEWVTRVYYPGHSFQLPGVLVEHVYDVGRRYALNEPYTEQLRTIQDVLNQTKPIVTEYIDRMKTLKQLEIW